MRRALLALSLALAVLPFRAHAQAPTEAPATNTESPLTVTSRLVPEPSLIGDALILELTVAYPQGYRVNLPTGLELRGFELRGQSESEPESTGEAWRKTFRLELQQWKSGTVALPAFELTYVDLAGEVRTHRVSGRKLEVKAQLVNEPDPQRRGEDPPISLVYPDESGERVIWGAAAGASALLFALFLWRRWQNRERPQPPVPEVPPELRARRAIQRLREDLLRIFGTAEEPLEPDSARVILYYLELTEVLKAYVQGRFGIAALDRTTDELRAALLLSGSGRSDHEGLDLQGFIDFLQDCDLVKFARFAPHPEEVGRKLDWLEALVEGSARPLDGDQLAQVSKASPTEGPSTDSGSNEEAAP